MNVLDPDLDLVFSELAWDPRVDPLAWQPGSTVFEELTAAGLPVVMIAPHYFDGSGLTRGGPARRPSSSPRAPSRTGWTPRSRRWPRHPRVLVYLYWGELDKVGHVHGCGSWEWGEELERVDGELARLVRGVRRDVLVTVTADHGMVDVPHGDRVDLADEPELRRGVRHLGGEARALHLYCEPGAADGGRPRPGGPVRPARRGGPAGRGDRRGAGSAPSRRTCCRRIGDLLAVALGRDRGRRLADRAPGAAPAGRAARRPHARGDARAGAGRPGRPLSRPGERHRAASVAARAEDDVVPAGHARAPCPADASRGPGRRPRRGRSGRVPPRGAPRGGRGARRGPRRRLGRRLLGRRGLHAAAGFIAAGFGSAGVGGRGPRGRLGRAGVRRRVGEGEDLGVLELLGPRPRRVRRGWLAQGLGPHAQLVDGRLDSVGRLGLLARRPAATAGVRAVPAGCRAGRRSPPRRSPGRPPPSGPAVGLDVVDTLTGSGPPRRGGEAVADRRQHRAAGAPAPPPAARRAASGPRRRAGSRAGAARRRSSRRAGRGRPPRTPAGCTRCRRSARRPSRRRRGRPRARSAAAVTSSSSVG